MSKAPAAIEAITSCDSGRRPGKRVARGPGSGVGKTAGRGEKGQTSRSGGGPHPLYEGGQFPFWMRLPKRGFSNVRHTVRYQPVSLAKAMQRIEGERIDLEALRAAGLANEGERVKLTAGTAIDRKIQVQVHRVTASVRDAIEAAGGSVEELDGRS